MKATLAAILLLAPITFARAAQWPSPNILWLIAEDFGPALSCYGRADLSTPHLDELAGSGVRYTRFYTTAPVCSPSPDSASGFCRTFTVPSTGPSSPFLIAAPFA